MKTFEKVFRIIDFPEDSIGWVLLGPWLSLWNFNFNSMMGLKIEATRQFIPI